jgi:hypothetical protein
MSRKKVSPIIITTSVLLVCLITFGSLSYAATISGTVFQSNGTTAITGVSLGIMVAQGDSCGWGSQVGSASTDSLDGTYTVTGVPAGTYYLRANNNGTNYVSEWWAFPTSEINCHNAQTVTVADGDTVTDMNFQLDLGGSISGTVYPTGVSVGIMVTQGDPCGIGWVVAGGDSINGTYTIRGVPVGDNYVIAGGQGTPYPSEWWADSGSQRDCQNAEPVTVTAGVDTPGKDFQLDLGGSISGMVYQSDGLTAVTGVQIQIQAMQSGPCGPSQFIANMTDPTNGTYTIMVPAGTYYLHSSNLGLSNYFNEWWAASNSVLDCSGAEPVTVNAGDTLSGKNFALDGEAVSPSGGTVS